MIGSDEKIEKIKKTAFDFFLETGYEATTIRMICKAAEIEAPTLYYFFKSKKGLFLTIRDEMEEDYFNQVIDLNLNKEETYNFIQRSFEQGRVETNGTEVSSILPPMNMFTPTNDRQEKKNNVIDKLLGFFNKFFNISSSKF